MSTAERTNLHLEWMRQGQDHLERTLSRLADEQLIAPVALSGWTGRHVLAHLNGNARALGRLVHWADTGEVTPMYADARERTREIDEGAAQPSAELRRSEGIEQRRLEEALRRLPAAGSSRTVTTAQGRQVPASVIPWLRVRELWVHAADLDDATFYRFPSGLLHQLMKDVLHRRRTVHGEILDVRPFDGPRPDETVERVWFEGTSADLTRWLTGRGVGGVRRNDDHSLPTLNPWL